MAGKPPSPHTPHPTGQNPGVTSIKHRPLRMRVQVYDIFTFGHATESERDQALLLSFDTERTVARPTPRDQSFLFVA